MTDNDRLLVRLLAETHAIFRITRSWRSPDPFWLARQRYRESGLAWASGASGAADQQAAHRVLLSAADAGLVEAVRPSGSRITAVKLTERGEARATALWGGFWLPATVRAMVLLDELSAGPDAIVQPEGFVWERWLGEYAGQVDVSPRDVEIDARLTELALLPGIVRGWVSGRSDFEGRGYYGLTEDGRTVLADPPQFAPTPRLKITREAENLYLAESRRAHEALATSGETANMLGDCPISCSPTTRRQAELRKEASV